MLKALVLGLVFIWIAGGLEQTLKHNAVVPVLAGIGTAIILATVFLPIRDNR